MAHWCTWPDIQVEAERKLTLDYEEVLCRFEKVKRHGNYATALCPAHGDQKPSMSIRRGDYTSAVFKCFSNSACTHETICRSANPPIDPRDLLINKGSNGVSVEAHYDYRDRRRNLLYQIVRNRPGSKLKCWSRRPDGSGGWINNLQGMDKRVLYRLPELLDSPLDRPVLIPEGEKHVERLRDIGYVSTCKAFGANGWRDEFSQELKDRRCIILPDYDSTGIRFAVSVARSLRGVASSVSILELDGLEIRDDVLDWLETHTKDELKQRVETAKPFTDADAVRLLALACELEAKEEGLNGKVSVEDSFDEISPINRFDLPPFPLEVLPESIAEFVKTTADELQMYPDIGMFAFAAFSAACIRSRCFVRIERKYVEPLNLYVMGVMEPGQRKSSVIERFGGQIGRFINDKRESLRNDFEIANAKYEMLEAELVKAKRKGDHKEVENCIYRLNEATKPVLPAWLVDNTTVEALEEKMEQQGGCAAVLSSEGGLIDNIAGRYSSGKANFDILLKAHVCEPVYIDRITRRSFYIEHPRLAIGLFVQPNVLQVFSHNSVFRDRGLTARISYFIPKSMVGYRKLLEDVGSFDFDLWGEHPQSKYDERLRWVLAQADKMQEVEFRLDDLARRVYEDFFNEMEKKIRPGAELDGISDWAAKAAGIMVRYAGVSHVMQHGLEQSRLVSGEHASKSVILMRYLTEHAKCAYDEMGVEDSTTKARRILRWLQYKELGSFRQSECYQALRGGSGFSSSRHLDDPLRLLERHNYIRRFEELPAQGRGRPRSPTYEVNPKLYVE